MVLLLWFLIGMVVLGTISVIVEKLEERAFEKEWREYRRHKIHNHFLTEMARVNNEEV